MKYESTQQSSYNGATTHTFTFGKEEMRLMEDLLDKFINETRGVFEVRGVNNRARTIKKELKRVREKPNEKCCPCPENPDKCRGECMCHHEDKQEDEEVTVSVVVYKCNSRERDDELSGRVMPKSEARRLGLLD